VIAYTLVMEARVVILPEHLDRVPLVATARRTMYNNQCDDPTHTLSFFLEHVCAAALYGERACNSGENGSQKLQYLPRFCPINPAINVESKPLFTLSLLPSIPFLFPPYSHRQSPSFSDPTPSKSSTRSP
jgi:hypothetical protein